MTTDSEVELKGRGRMSDRWGFEEADDWEAEAPRPRAAVEALVGRDGVVAVAVETGGAVVGVRLALGWRESRGLAAAVVSAANEATARALAWQAGNPAPVTAPMAGGDEAPITAADALRLVEAVSADLAEFARRTAEAAGPMTARSAGGHVGAVARAGRVAEVSIDPGWANAVRASEVESELLDVLRALRERGAVDRPESGAIAELTALLGDPNALLRRVGLVP
ncbi:hypothetical protein [Umezawaea sp. Da 62-37]|uniref:hypothetical protein n=1 Tax=Umezawaea sp. Da 62-37 TaxID=3075927 RepID=UPI0028F70CD4|nr:hypothetical protein [Umezawaea sp. Da 62-37]WNV82077.1 hypothetical protein RM788_28115 [Umezawaea sp. Da 62-37]